MEHCVAGGKLIFEVDLQAVELFLSQLTVENCIAIYKNKVFEGKTECKERWYGTQYNKRSFSAAQVSLWTTEAKAAWASLLHLPEKNPFIPSDFGLKSASYGELQLDVEPAQLSGQAAASPAEPVVEEENPEPAESAETEEEDNEEDEESTQGADTVLPPLAGKQETLWFKQDCHWQVPKAHTVVKLENHIVRIASTTRVRLLIVGIQRY